MYHKSDVAQISINNPNFSFDYSSLASLPNNLRTLLIHNSHRIEPEKWSLVWTRFRVLRTLQLSNSNLNHLPNSIGDMIHLRYLNLSFNWNLKTLPDSICNLYHLHTLNLEGCLSLKALPSSFTFLSLKHLFLKNCISLSHVPLGRGSLTSLVTLDRLIVNHHYGGLEYLKHLDSLRGVLTIELPLAGWPNCKEDAKELNMSEKCRLHGMNISWIKPEAETLQVIDKNDAKEVLSALVLHPFLGYLNIDGHIGDALSGWDELVKMLKKLVLINCSFEYLDYRVGLVGMFHTSLKTLILNSLTSLKGWRDIESDSDHISRLPSLPNVIEVVIQNCPQLTEKVPLFVGAEVLHLSAVNVKLVEMLLTANGSCSASSSASTSVCQYDSKLVELQLHRVESLTDLPLEWIQHLTALKTLTISGCEKLDSVSSHGLGCLRSLETLSIFDCGVVKIEDLGVSEGLQRLRDLTVPWQENLQKGLQYLTSLERLEIHCCGSEIANQDTEVLGEGLTKLCRFKLNFGGGKHCCPSWIKDLCSLKEVEFCDCEELSLSWTTLINMEKLLKLDFIKVNDVTIAEAVGEKRNQCSSLEEMYISDSEKEGWISKSPWKFFPSLQILSLSNIPNLNSLPNGIQHLTSLDRLIIQDCSKKLKNRCTRMGADWHLISRIGDVDIRCSSKC